MMKRLSSDAVERILRAVGPKIKPIQISSPNEPPVLDLDLLYSLHESIEYYYGAVQRRSDKKKLDRIRRLKAISKAAGRLEDLLKPDDDWEWAQDSEHEFLLGRISDLRSKVESEIDDLKHKIEWGDDADDIGMGKSRDLTDALRTRSPFEWLVGSYLPETFRKCF